MRPARSERQNVLELHHFHGESLQSAWYHTHSHRDDFLLTSAIGSPRGTQACSRWARAPKAPLRKPSAEDSRHRSLEQGFAARRRRRTPKAERQHAKRQAGEADEGLVLPRDGRD